MKKKNEQDIEIRIEFERGSGDPSCVFRSMAGLIESTQLLDTHLALSIGADVRTSLVLQDVEAASLKAKLSPLTKSSVVLRRIFLKRVTRRHGDSFKSGAPSQGLLPTSAAFRTSR
jgi:hypothetical protein